MRFDAGKCVGWGPGYGSILEIGDVMGREGYDEVIALKGCSE